MPFVWFLFALPSKLLSWFSVSLAERLPFSHTIRWTVLAADLFDRFSPPVEHRFTEEGVRRLHERCGLERIEVRRYMDG